MQISKTLTITIGRPYQEVYGFVSDLANLPKWAGAFCQSIQPHGDAWLAVTPMGPLTIRMAPKNDYGICDHVVIPDPNYEIDVPMRVICNGEDASDVIFTLFRRQGMSESQFADDARMVEQDLRALKAILEKS